jgi:hypothetical protein
VGRRADLLALQRHVGMACRHTGAYALVEIPLIGSRIRAVFNVTEQGINLMNREKLKPFIGGAVVGVALAAIVAFSAGLIVTASSNARQVELARVDGQASICASLAQAHRDQIGDTADLSSYQAREARDDLAKTFAVALRGADAADAAVISACSNLLKTNGVS